MTTAYSVKTSAPAFAESKQIYRGFRNIDPVAYKAQGEFTCCALRGGSLARLEKPLKGNDILLVLNGEQGVALFSGKKMDALTIGMGHLAYRVSKKYKIRWFTGYNALVAFIKKEGTVVKIAGKPRKCLEGKKYSFYLENDRVKRHEWNTNSRGKAWAKPWA